MQRLCLSAGALCWLGAPLIRGSQEPGVLQGSLAGAGVKGMAGIKQVVKVGQLQIFLSQS